MTENKPEVMELDENLLLGIYIQIARLYDVALAVLANKDQQAAKELMEAHKNGYLVGPPPALSGDDDEIQSE